MCKNTNSPLSWFVPSVLTAIVGLAAIWQGYKVSKVSTDTLSSLEISKIKLEIMSSAKEFDRKSSEILLTHVLKPIDTEKSYKDFRNDFISLTSEIAPNSPTSAKQTQIITKIDSSLNNINYAKLVNSFKGDKRLLSSDKLVLAYEKSPKEVVSALIEGLLPVNNKNSYRVNLYIAFTLARFEPEWNGTTEQFEKIQSLKDTSNYTKDKTFQRRVDESIDNYSAK